MLSFAVTHQDEGREEEGGGDRGENMKMHFTSLYPSSGLDVVKRGGMDLLLYVLYLIGYGNI